MNETKGGQQVGAVACAALQYTAIVQHTAPSREATTQMYSRFVGIPRCPA